MLRTLADHKKCFSENVKPKFYEVTSKREPIYDSFQLECELRKQMNRINADGKAALALSGGIDSAVLAKFMPKGSTVYTFKCIVPGMQVTDESPAADRYAEECGLVHKIVEIYWEDFEKFSPVLMKNKGTPIHSIEVQIYKASLQAKEDGFNTLIFGESADLNYGGLSDLLSKDRTVGDFIQRYAYVMPFKALKDYVIPMETITPYINDGYVDVHEFCRNPFFIEAMGSYSNATETAGIKLETPYACTYMGIPMDYERLRKGENKYLVREVFSRLYEGFTVPTKTPMPRPMNEWFKDWSGPVRPEFWPHCTDDMNGDQRWLVWCLERFLDLLDKGELND